MTNRTIPTLTLVLALALAPCGCFTVSGHWPDRLTTDAEAVQQADGGGLDLETEVGAGAPDSPTSRTMCRPRPFRAVSERSDYGPRGAAGAGSPTCAIDEQGALSMSFSPRPVCMEPRLYWSCFFTAHEDLTAFEMGNGVLGVSYCAEGPVCQAVDIWHQGTSVGSPKERFLKIHDAQDLSASSCRTVFLSALDSCPIDGGPCRPACGPPAVEDGGVDGTGGGLDANQDAAGGFPDAEAPLCGDFHDRELRLTTEFCPIGGACPSPASVHLRLLSLVYYPNDCACSSDADCTAPDTFCRRDAWPSFAACWRTPAGCPGVCTR